MSSPPASPAKRQKLAPASLLPPLEQFPVSLADISPLVAGLLRTASQDLTKESADAARESTFQYLQNEDDAVVEKYTPVYAAAQLFYAQGCYREAEQHLASLNNKSVTNEDITEQSRSELINKLNECLRAVDLTILRTSVGIWSDIARKVLQHAEVLRSELLIVEENYDINKNENTTLSLSDAAKNVKQSSDIPPQFMQDSCRGSDIPRIDASTLSIESFVSEYMTCPPSPSPVILCNAISTWPALKKWGNMEYLKKKAAGRLVPIETYEGKDATQTYLTKSWERQVMPFGEFLDTFVMNVNESTTKDRGYLAQYQLFDQIPSLMDDISVPSYCCATTEEDNSAPPNSESTPPTSPLVSAWFGPKGTVSPLHNDPYHNLLAQVVGTKYLRLYDISETYALYPREGPLCNNSYLDLDKIMENDKEAARFPLYQKAKFQHCVLQPGEVLYIPRHYWHYVRSLDTSFSTSFWWGAKMALQMVPNCDSDDKAKYVASY